MAESERRTEHEIEKPISNGPNARARDEPTGQTGHGLPDDSSKPVELTPEEEAAIADKIIGSK